MCINNNTNELDLISKAIGDTQNVIALAQGLINSLTKLQQLSSLNSSRWHNSLDLTQQVLPTLEKLEQNLMKTLEELEKRNVSRK